MDNILHYVLLGVISGIASGVLGIGGGIILIPPLVLLFGFTQLQAQGTTLALLAAPIGILAVSTYYQQGYVDLRIAVFVGVGDYQFQTNEMALIAGGVRVGLEDNIFYDRNRKKLATNKELLNRIIDVAKRFVVNI